MAWSIVPICARHPSARMRRSELVQPKSLEEHSARLRRSLARPRVACNSYPASSSILPFRFARGSQHQALGAGVSPGTGHAALMNCPKSAALILLAVSTAPGGLLAIATAAKEELPCVLSDGAFQSRFC